MVDIQSFCVGTQTWIQERVDFIDAIKDTFNLKENRNFIFQGKKIIEILGDISQCHLTS